ncbi:MAG TPA: cytochrome P450 [Kofleriaceae bacterium]|nr:cytochrome P450 [Kofleriaceae bacterium]
MIASAQHLAHDHEASYPPPRPPWFPTTPGIGAYLEIRGRDKLSFLSTVAAAGDVVRFNVLGLSVVMLSAPAHIEHVLVKNARAYSKDVRSYRQLKLVLGNGLLTSEGDSWLRNRRIAQPAFHRQRIAAMGEVMATAAAGARDALTGAAEGGEVIDMASEMMHLTLRVVGEAMLSRDVTREVDEVSTALTTTLKYIERKINRPWMLPPWVPTPTNQRFVGALSRIDKVVAEIITARRESPEADDRDLLGLLMNATDADTGETMTDRQLRDEVMTIFLAGHETTANALTWALYLLARNPAIAAEVRREVADEIGDATVTAKNVAGLDLVGRVLSEAMRLYPPAWIMERAPQRDDVIGGFRVTPRDLILMSPWVTHRRPDLWPDPERFDPSRFSDENSRNRQRYAYFPFGGGQRKCIGDGFALLEAKIILATLVRAFSFSYAGEGDAVPEPLVTLRPTGGMPMRIAPVG